MEKKTKHFFVLFFFISFRLLLVCVFLYSFFASILLFIAMELRERDTTAHVKNNLWELRIYCLYFFSFGIIFRWPFSFCHAYVVVTYWFFKLRLFWEYNLPSNYISRLQKRAVFSVVHIQFQGMLLLASFLQTSNVRTSFKKPYDLLVFKINS